MQGITVQKLSKTDLPKFIETIRLFENVFERENFSMPPTSHLQNLLNKEDFYVFVAIIEDKIVGGLTAYTLQQYYSVKPLAYIYDLAVDNAYQRKGIGKQLISAINDFCKQNGFEEVFVQAEKEDEHAVDFYHKTHPTEAAEVMYFAYLLNK